MTGKLQTFYDADFWYYATLRRNKEGAAFPFTLRVRDRGKMIFIGGFFSALEAKNFLEHYDESARWYTDRGYVDD